MGKRLLYSARKRAGFRFIETHVPGAMKAWDRDVGLPMDEFTFGITGGSAKYPLRAVAHSRGWFDDPPDRRRYECLAAEKTWRPTHG